jgi:hypothetical protein
VVLDKDAFTYSTPSRKWSEWLSQKERHNATGKYYKAVHKWVLGLYMGSQFLFYPLMVVALFTFDWKWVLGLLILKLLIQGLVFYKSMKKLGESDLFIFFPLFDLWMFFYYLIFMSSLWKTPKTHWN